MMVEPYKSVGHIILFINCYADISLPTHGPGWLTGVPLIPHLISVDPLKVLGGSVAPKQHPPLVDKQSPYKVLIH